MAGPSEGEGLEKGPLLDQEGRTYRFVEPPEAWGRGIVRAPIDQLSGEDLALPGPYIAFLPLDEVGEQSIGNLLAVAGGCVVPPCPRPLARLKAPGAGVVLQIAAESLEAWWQESLLEPSAIPMLFEVLAEVCDRLGDFRQFSWDEPPSDPLLHGQSIRRREGEAWRLHSLHRTDPELPDVELGLSKGGDWAPEVLFRARRNDPSAADSWSLGELILRMLRYRNTVLGGTPEEDLRLDSELLRSHRCRLVEDLFLRKPGQSRDRPINPNDFLYPNSLPAPDAQVVRISLEGFCGQPIEAVERRLAAPLLELLGRAMAIDPAERFLEARELGSDLRAWAKDGRSVLARHGGRSEGNTPATNTETRLLAGLMPSLARGEAPTIPDLLMAQLEELPRVVHTLDTRLSTLEKRLKSQERNLEAIAGMEMGAYTSPGGLDSPVKTSSGMTAAWLLGAANLVLVILVGSVLWMRISSVEAPSGPVAQTEEAPTSETTSRPTETRPEWEPLPPELQKEPRPNPTANPTPDPVRSPASNAGASAPNPTRAENRPVPIPEELPPVEEVQVRFRSGTGFLKDGASQRMNLQNVPPGAYQVWWAKTGEEPTMVSASLEIPAKSQVDIKCGFDRCKVEVD